MLFIRQWVIRILLLTVLPAGFVIVLQGSRPDLIGDIARIRHIFVLMSLFAILAGWRFRRPDIMWHAALFGLCGWALLIWGLTSPVQLDALGVNLVWSTVLLFCLWLGSGADRPFKSSTGVINLGILLVVPVLFRFWMNGQLPDSVTRFLEDIPGRFARGSTAIPLSLTILISAVIVARTLRHRTSAHLATWGAVLSISAGFMFASDFSLPFFACLVAQSILLIGVVDQISRIAFLDALTGLPGRRALEPVLNQLKGMYTIAVADIDHFKRFNDRYGHDVGDQVLRKVAFMLERPGAGGQTYRVGGEEFLLLFTGKHASDVQPVLDALRKSIEDEPFRIRDKRSRKRSDATRRGRGSRSKGTVTVTVSIGLADATRTSSPKQTWKAADKALYRAKKRGRNRVCR